MDRDPLSPSRGRFSGPPEPALVRSILGELGVNHNSWSAILLEVEARLGTEKADRFARLHRNFIAYPAESTLKAFYGFAFREGLAPLLNGVRAERLTALFFTVLPFAQAGRLALDLGAGGGFIARLLRRFSPGLSLRVFDLVPEAMEDLAGAGFGLWSAGDPPVDLIFCLDSLGEVNADQDSALAEALAAEEEGPRPESGGGAAAALLEERYGFAQKLEPWKRALKEGGLLLLVEPVSLPGFWKGLEALLSAAGWRAEPLPAAAPLPGLFLRKGSSEADSMGMPSAGPPANPGEA